MRVLLAAVGTRGDVQPALGLAVELRRLGHEARLCVSPNFVEQAESLGFEALPMGVEMRAPAKGAAPLTAEELRRLRDSMPDLITDQFETIGAAARGCDVIVGANAHQYAAPSIAERARIGCVTAVYAPVAVPSTDLEPPPPPGQGAAPATSASIEQRWRDTAAAWNSRALDRINANRERLGMRPIRDVLDYVLTDRTWLAADGALAPLPTTEGRQVFQTGAWVLPDNRPLSPDIEAFLDRGPPPVFVGFGSMPASADVSRVLTAAARAAGRRLILSSGWAGLELVDAASDCLLVGDVSHELLFPRVAAVVPHGGAGTTAAAARAGVPQVITPLFGDQFYWSSRVVALGIGATIAHAGMTEGSLQSALRQVIEPAVAARARAFASQVGSNGAVVAAQRLELEYAS